MASLRWLGGALLPAVLAAACGGSSSSGGSGGGSDGAANGDTSATTDSATGGDGAGSGSDSSTTGDSPAMGPDSSAMDSSATNDGASRGDASDAASDASAAPCPDEQGAYSITAVDATGCGSSFNAGARQCIRQTSSACTIHFQSTGTSNVAINGDATLQSDGSFSGAALTEGTLNRTGCTGMWDSAGSTLTVDCGGTGSSQACVLSLKRTSTTCP